MVVPQGAVMYICAVECQYIRKQNRRVQSNRHNQYTRSTICFKVFICFLRFVYPGFQHIFLHGIRLECTEGRSMADLSSSKVSLDEYEPYTSEYLQTLPGGYRLLTKPQQFFSIDFSDRKVTV